MNHNKSFLTIQFLMLGLIICFLSAGVANAAPLYKGRFRLPNEVRWGHAVLPASDYQLNFEDIGTRAFVLIRQTKVASRSRSQQPWPTQAAKAPVHCLSRVKATNGSSAHSVWLSSARSSFMSRRPWLPPEMSRSRKRCSPYRYRPEVIGSDIRHRRHEVALGPTIAAFSALTGPKAAQKKCTEHD